MTKEEMRAEGYYSLFGDCYALLAKADKTHMDWDMLVKEADNIGKRWAGTGLERLANDIILAIITEMEKF